MNKNVCSSFSIFFITPFLIFAMVLPVVVLTFSFLKIDTSAYKIPYNFPENSSHDLVNMAFAEIPSNGNHPIGDYINSEEVQSGDTKLAEIPAIDFTADLLPEDARAVFSSNLSQNGNLLINDTDNYVDIEQIMARAHTAKITSEPLVLVVHTHATESFMDTADNYRLIDNDGNVNYYYSPSQSDFRSTDITKSVVHLGNIFTDELNALGIPTLHCETLHDYPDYNKSYSNSFKSVSEYLAKYPSIKYVIDLHRDSIVKKTGEKLKPLCTINGEDVAQTMLVIGSGPNHPNWKDNLSLALNFKTTCETLYPTISRPVYLRTWNFNQQLSSGSMILEVGSCGNTLAEVERAALYSARVLAKTITN